jgi:hypothetical protein
MAERGRASRSRRRSPRSRLCEDLVRATRAPRRRSPAERAVRSDLRTREDAEPSPDTNPAFRRVTVASSLRHPRPDRRARPVPCHPARARRRSAGSRPWPDGLRASSAAHRLPPASDRIVGVVNPAHVEAQRTFVARPGVGARAQIARDVRAELFGVDLASLRVERDEGAVRRTQHDVTCGLRPASPPAAESFPGAMTCPSPPDRRRARHPTALFPAPGSARRSRRSPPCRAGASRADRRWPERAPALLVRPDRRSRRPLGRASRPTDREQPNAGSPDRAQSDRLPPLRGSRG